MHCFLKVLLQTFTDSFQGDDERQAREFCGVAQPEVAAAGEDHLRRPGGQGAAVGDGLQDHQVRKHQ